MKTQNLGYPRIGRKRELKRAEEAFWSGEIEEAELLKTAKELRLANWRTQQKAGIDLIPSNDFSLYDQVLDTAFSLGVVPQRFSELAQKENLSPTELYFALARGYQKNDYDLTALEMTKWFDTNYHYIVPEFNADQEFRLRESPKIVEEYLEARQAGIETKPVLLGPISFLLLGKEKEAGFHRLRLIHKLLPVYKEIVKQLREAGARYIQLDEPCLVTDLSDEERNLYKEVYTELDADFPELHFILTAYFEAYGENLETVVNLPVQTLHLDLIRGSNQLDELLRTNFNQGDKNLSLGIIDGRNIWKNDFAKTLETIKKATDYIGRERLWLAPSCSLLHVPYDLNLETNEKVLPKEVKNWLAFAQQKIEELAVLKELASESPSQEAKEQYKVNQAAQESRRNSTLIHNVRVKDRVNRLTPQDAQRSSVFSTRKQKQQEDLNLPLFPTTTIGSLPQTSEIRRWRAQWKKGNLSTEEYDNRLKTKFQEAIAWQEELGIDVLVHGEFERNDMVEYFGERLEGFVFTQFGWVQSYGSRCVKPPIILGDISRTKPITVYYTKYAQSLTQKPVKGMLTGPVTILQWSFVRDDQARSETCKQIALAIRDEVVDLEKEGIKIIQIDEPALREGLPLHRRDWQEYLSWAVKSFRIASSGVKDETQLHTHMCYSEFNDIIENIAQLDADVITIETSRSQMELLDAFADFHYPNDIGPGVYDIHSPRVPSKEEIVDLIQKASKVIPEKQLWVNPDCGLKTRKWEETKVALQNMLDAAFELRN